VGLLQQSLTVPGTGHAKTAVRNNDCAAINGWNAAVTVAGNAPRFVWDTCPCYVLDYSGYRHEVVVPLVAIAIHADIVKRMTRFVWLD